MNGDGGNLLSDGVDLLGDVGDLLGDGVNLLVNGVDLIGDGVDLLGDGVDLLIDGGNLLSDGGSLLGDGGNGRATRDWKYESVTNGPTYQLREGCTKQKPEKVWSFAKPSQVPQPTCFWKWVGGTNP